MGEYWIMTGAGLLKLSPSCSPSTQSATGRRCQYIHFYFFILLYHGYYLCFTSFIYVSPPFPVIIYLFHLGTTYSQSFYRNRLRVSSPSYLLYYVTYLSFYYSYFYLR